MEMGMKRICVALCAWTMLVSAVGAASMDEEMTLLKDKLGKQLVAKGRKKVAALDFTDLQGRKNELGRYLAEQLTVELVGAEGIAVVDRANLKSILDEHKLTEEGLVNPENAKKLGQFAGVDAIIIGNVSVTNDEIVLLTKAISTETAEVVAAARSKFAKNGELAQMMSKTIAPGAQSAAGQAASTSGPNVQDASSLATKDLGPLRVAIKGITPLSPRPGYGDGVAGALFSLELTNTDLQKTLYVGQNVGKCETGQDTGQFKSVSHAITQDGTTWEVTEERGLPKIQSDKASTIVDTLRSGKHVAEVRQGHVVSYSGNDQPPEEWAGEFVAIPPGESVRASITFGTPQGTPIRSLQSLQVEAQWIVGVAESETATPKYTLRNVTFDKITLSKAGGPPPTNR